MTITAIVLYSCDSPNCDRRISWDGEGGRFDVKNHGWTVSMDEYEMFENHLLRGNPVVQQHFCPAHSIVDDPR